MRTIGGVVMWLAGAAALVFVDLTIPEAVIVGVTIGFGGVMIAGGNK